MGDEHVGGDGRMGRVHAALAPERVVDREDARGLGADVGIVELEDGHVGEPDPRHARLRTGGELEACRRPRAVGGALRREPDVVLPRVPLGLVRGARTGVRDEESGGGQLDGSTPPAAIHRLMVSWASAGEYTSSSKLHFPLPA